MLTRHMSFLSIHCNWEFQMEYEDQVGGSFQETLTSMLDHSKSRKTMPIFLYTYRYRYPPTMGHPAAVRWRFELIMGPCLLSSEPISWHGPIEKKRIDVEACCFIEVHSCMYSVL